MYHVLDSLETGNFTVYCTEWRQRAKEGRDMRGKQ